MIHEPLKAPHQSAVPYKLTYPVLVSRKLDGIRCLVLDGIPCTRTFKSIPNRHIGKKLMELFEVYGKGKDLDGELLTFTDGKMDEYNTVQSKVMSQDGEPDFVYYIFDLVLHASGLKIPYAIRYSNLLAWYVHDEANGVSQHKEIQLLIQTEIKDKEDLEVYETEALAAGFEGVMIRNPLGWYKCGRATTNENIIHKLKRFEDGEAIIINMLEMMHNTNAQTRDEFGLSKRSKELAGMIPSGLMGKLVVQDVKTKIVFEIGTGFTLKQREEMWKHTTKHLGQTIKYKHQPHGAKDKPRCPVFIGFRNPIDL